MGSRTKRLALTLAALASLCALAARISWDRVNVRPDVGTNDPTRRAGPTPLLSAPSQSTTAPPRDAPKDSRPEILHDAEKPDRPWREKIGIPNERTPAVVSQIESVQLAVRLLHEKSGRMPITSNRELLRALQDTSLLGVALLEPDPRTISSNGSLLDPWGTELRFDFDPRTAIFTIRAAGPDRRFLTADDYVREDKLPPVQSSPLRQ